MQDENPPLDDENTRYQPAARSPQFGKNKKRHHTWLLWVGLAVVLLAIGGGVYAFVLKKDSPKPQPAPVVTSSTKTVQPVGSAPDANATSKTYKSPTLNIEFTYRSDWTMKESADKAEITLTSPRVSYTALNGTATEGVFTLKMRHGIIPDAMQATVQKTVVVKDSEVIAYAAPTDAQRQYTTISYGGSDAKSFGYFMVTGSVAYKLGQNFDSQINLQGNAYLFAGGYGADTTDALAFDPVPAAAFDTPALQQALAVIKSLKVY